MMDGLCCNYGIGRVSLYNGTFANGYDDTLLLFQSTAEGMKRYTQSFYLF